jgi:hypothetical protein
MLVDGVYYSVNWMEFTVGSSFFVPCLRDAAAREYLERKITRLGYAVAIKVVIEDGIRGLRVWRIRKYNSGATSQLL